METEKVKQLGNNEYMTPRQCGSLLGLCVRTIYYHLEANLIPCIRKVFYSRRQYDKAMGIESELEQEYYTMPEAMARYNMTRDQISHYVRTHNIPRSNEGRYVRIDRKALDALFAPPKIG